MRGKGQCPMNGYFSYVTFNGMINLSPTRVLNIFYLAKHNRDLRCSLLSGLISTQLCIGH